MRVRYSFSSRRTGHTEKMRKQREKYPSLARKIIQKSDIILEVLDSRFITETRNPELERDIKKQEKRIIFVLNKLDMVNQEDIDPENIKTLNPKIFVSCTSRKGISELRDRIKIIASTIKNPVDKALKKVSVGIIGYPNTGKSSLINVLIGKRSAGVGAEAGFTKGIQKINLTREIVLLDSPGVIPQEQYSEIKQEAITKHTKLGARDYSQVKNPELVVINLMKEFKGLFEKFYNIDSNYGDSELLMEELGRRKGFLKKGGIVDEDKTARYILRDWQRGKIK